MANTFPPAFRGKRHRPSAAAWNAINAAIDPAKRVSVTGPAPSLPRLPAVEGLLARATTGFRAAVAGEAVHLVSSSGEDVTAATVPIAASMTTTDVERVLTGAFRARYKLLEPTAAGVSLEDPVAICVDSRRGLFALSGLAWCRVRALRGWHRFARRCLPQPGDGTVELAESVGCLDSCGWGPVEILGWVTEGFHPSQQYQGLASTQSAYLSGPGRIGWALVRL